MFNFLAKTSSAAGGAGGGGITSTIILVVEIAVIIALMYFIIIRPQKKKQKEEQKLRDSIAIGDEIITIGGLYGRIVSIKEDEYVIESVSDANHAKFKIKKWAVQTNLTVHEEAVANGKKAK